MKAFSELRDPNLAPPPGPEPAYVSLLLTDSNFQMLKSLVTDKLKVLEVQAPEFEAHVALLGALYLARPTTASGD